MLGTNKDVVVVEDIVVDNIFSIHHASWITSGPKICDNIPTKVIWVFFGCSE